MDQEILHNSQEQKQSLQLLESHTRGQDLKEVQRLGLSALNEGH